MRRSKLYPLVALAMSAVVPQLAQAQLGDTQWVRPAMMLLVDTSGSMERKPDVGSSVDQLPKCTNNTASDERNRWAITLEALTGTFKTYACSERPRTAFTGEFDQAYFLPHYEFVRLPPDFKAPADGGLLRAQNEDGLLDSFAQRLKFGLMTFDGVGTTVNGATLVPFDDFPGNKSTINGQLGQYSYPLDDKATPKLSGVSGEVLTPDNSYGWKPLSFPGCPMYYGVNAGARNKQLLPNGEPMPGSLISVGPTDDQASVSTINQRIQDSLLQVRPYAGTPIAAMLDDLRYYLRNDTDINSTDPFYSCRDRYAVLLTDGAPDAMFRGGSFQCDTQDPTLMATCAKYNSTTACQCPYDTSTSLASKLIQEDKLKNLWVVAFNVNDSIALAALDNIALMGGTTSAYRSNTLTDLRTNLSNIFTAAEPEATSRSVPVVINTGRAVMLANGKQFRISAGFKVNSTADTPWEGRLWRQRIECVDGAVKEQPLTYSSGDIFHEKLNKTSAASRTLLTVLPSDTTKVSGTILNRDPTSNMSYTSTLNVKRPDGNTFGASSETDISANTTQEGLQSKTPDKVSPTPATLTKSISKAYFDNTDATRDRVYDFVSGADGTYRADHKLGDIYHSNPAVLPPIFPGSDLLSGYDPQLRSFYLNLIDATKTGGYWGRYSGTHGRPGAVFVASNDGLLHSFNLDDWTNKSGTKIEGGTEFWALMPPASFGMMSSVSSPAHQFAFDGTPVVKDVIMNSASTTSPVSTVLLIAVRGVAAYVALDVTWPDSPKFLWQRSFKYLGKTVGTPMLANVRIRWGNSTDPTIRAVAILPGGEGWTNGNKCAVNVDSRGKAPNAGARDNVRCWGFRGRSLYVVDVETGELVQEFDQRHFPSAVTGSVAVDGEELSVSRAAYFTDADGVLYRLSMGSSDPRDWRVVPLWDVFGGQATNFSGTPVDAYGGSTNDWKAGRAASFPPVINRDPVTGNLTIVVGTGDVDDLGNPTANRVVSITEKRQYDGTELYSSSPSLQNWALQLDANESVTGPMVVLDETLYFTSFTGPASGTKTCSMGTSRIVGAHIRNKGTNGLPVPRLSPEGGGALVLSYVPSDKKTSESLLLGLSISRDPVCFQGTASTDPINAALGGRVTGQKPSGGNYSMRALVAGKGGDVMAGSNTADKGQRIFGATLPAATTTRSVGWASSIE